MKDYFLILASVLLNGSAQLLIKKGMVMIGHVQLTMAYLPTLIVKAATNIPILLGMGSYVVSLLLWMVILSRFEVSKVYPLISIGYIYTAIMAFFLFNEPLTWQKIAGIFVICGGIFLINWSE